MKTLWLVALAAATGLMAGERPGSEPVDVTVYLASDGSAPLYQSRVLATSMFDRIGVRVAWRRDEPKAAAPGSVTLQVRLAQDPPSGYRPEVLAYAYPYAAADQPITVFCGQVRRTALATGIPEYVLLAHVLVHEITHVLERVDRHSETGVMKATYSPEDRLAMVRGTLSFEPKDVNLIHKGLTTLQPDSATRTGAF
jgi:hypothetical protein